MANKSETVEILTIDAAEDIISKAGWKSGFDFCERDMKQKYLNAEAKSKYEQTLTAVDRTMTLQAFVSTDAFTPYVPELYLDMAMKGLTPKREPYWNKIFSASITVNRNDYAWLGVADEKDPNKKARWQFITAGNSPDQRRSTLVKRMASLRRYGQRRT